MNAIILGHSHSHSNRKTKTNADIHRELRMNIFAFVKSARIDEI